MGLLDIKEKINRVRFFMDKVRYKREKHFYFAVFGLLFCLVALFTVVYIDQQMEIRRKENILKSYYSEINTGNAGLDGIAGGTDEAKTLSEKKEDYSGKSSTGDIGNNDDSDDSPQITNIIKAYICGEVKNPGVYELEDGARIIDLLELAGGQGENACLEIINLAQIVADGQRIYIPSQEEISGSNSLFFTGDYLNDYGSSENRLVNINTANSKELESLPGIGPVIASNIIEYRNSNGSFKKKEELKNVTGIGEKKYEEIEQFVSI